MNLESPVLLWALAGLLPLILVFVFEYRHTQHALRVLAQGLTDPVVHRLIFWKWLLALVFFIMFYIASVLALCGWEWGEQAKPQDRNGLELVVVVDVSRSMVVTDVSPRRLDRALAIIQAVGDSLPAARYALVGFSGTAERIVPMTEDRLALVNGLNRLRGATGMLDGSRPSEGLDVGLASFQPTSNRNQVILLVSDGEFRSRPDSVLSQIRRRGIPLAVLGTGTLVGGPIPRADGAWELDAAGRQVYSRLDEAALQDFARQTRGVYVNAASGDPSGTLSSWLVQFQQQSEQQGFRLVPVERESFFIAVALFFLVAFILVRSIRWRTLW